ncbi:uncharacterized protein [Ptychodera flava]|uniref:uncharacterized protein n=1 Tax=Ptychodera flava TaxID=63121 RepID=UPI003969E7EF
MAACVCRAVSPHVEATFMKPHFPNCLIHHPLRTCGNSCCHIKRTLFHQGAFQVCLLVGYTRISSPERKRQKNRDSFKMKHSVRLFMVLVVSGILARKALADDDMPCEADEFRCDNGDCIPNSYICDQVADCVDMEEEEDCPGSRKCEGLLRCNNGVCMIPTVACDGENDCPDGEDEEGC